jgi:hypothetical protein
MLSYDTLRRQIGLPVILSVNGGRMVRVNASTYRFPVSSRYAVEIELDESSDLYLVRRTYTRKEHGIEIRRVEGERAGVPADQLSSIFALAGQYKAFPDEGWASAGVAQ